MRKGTSPRQTRLGVPAPTGPLSPVVARSAELSMRRCHVDISLVVCRKPLCTERNAVRPPSISGIQLNLKKSWP